MSVEEIKRKLKEKRITEPISLLGFEGNWGPPVSGRYNSDYLKVWAGVRKDIVVKKVELNGTGFDSAWSINHTLSQIEDEETEDKLYYVQVDGFLPVEFILTLETEEVKYKDNNGSVKIVPYAGRFVFY